MRYYNWDGMALDRRVTDANRDHHLHIHCAPCDQLGCLCVDKLKQNVFFHMALSLVKLPYNHILDAWRTSRKSFILIEI